MEMTVADNVALILAVVVLSPFVAFVLFRAAASGWFGVKHYYQRRLIDDIRKGDEIDG
jgi:hypothetical protein